ncbi:nucleotidyltransferase family protein [Massilia sp. TWP1-3-3]|uniref:nucleotidyltransferase family protein n=1 Tax=Massilia sp. TWP1-3-3 TaxID=2804573 RepID=UPI003CF60555
MDVVGILLAAGRGRRFDPTGARNKLLAPLAGGEPVALASARTMLAVLPRVVAVVPSADGSLAAALRAIGCEVTAVIGNGAAGGDTERGMAASLVHAVRHSLPAGEAWIIALADMPYVQRATIAALRDALDAGAAIAAPVQGGRRGNPIAFGLTHLAALLALEGDQGARAILQQHAVTEIAVRDPGIFQDIDTPSDLPQRRD